MNGKEFNIPDSLIEQFYELSGDADKHKGVIIVMCSEAGQPMIFSRFDSALTEMGLRKVLENFLKDADQANGFDNRDLLDKDDD